MKTKKFICLFLLLCPLFKIIPEDITINEVWIKGKMNERKKIRQKGSKEELTNQDSLLMNTVENQDLHGIEGPVSIYLHEIIFEDKNKNNLANIDRAFDIMMEKFENKAYFINITKKISGSDVEHDPLIIKKILEGYSKLMENNSDDIFKDFGSFKKNVDYFLKKRNIYGSEFAIMSYIAFLRKYIILVESEKISDNQRNLIIQICDALDFDNNKTGIGGYIGAQELKEEYFYYKNF